MSTKNPKVSSMYDEVDVDDNSIDEEDVDSNDGYPSEEEEEEEEEDDEENYNGGGYDSEEEKDNYKSDIGGLSGLKGGTKEGANDEEDDDDVEGKQQEQQQPFNNYSDTEDDDDNEEDDELYFQKFDKELNKKYIVDFHPECIVNNYDEISSLTRVVRDKYNNIIDDLHMTLPYLTKYEKARILGQRTKQINAGAKAFVKVPEGVIDGYLIAEMELSEKRIPYIIRRPKPGGGCEYWNLKDLEIIIF